MEENQLTPDFPMVLIGGSAGSLTVLFELLPTLPEVFSYTLLIVVHRKNSSDSSLSELLGLKSKAPVLEIDDKQVIRPGIVYLAPADYHVLIESDLTFSLDASEKVNFSRPSLDVTFESAAEAFGTSLTAIILSGANEDGSKGMQAIAKAGGQLIAQDPSTAQMSVMPQQAILLNDIQTILSPVEIEAYMATLV